jgi:Type II secretion system (T2SS), protein M subtype b
MKPSLHRPFALLRRAAAVLILVLVSAAPVYLARVVSTGQLQSMSVDIKQNLEIRQKLQSFLVEASKIDPTVRQKEALRFSTDFLAGAQDPLIVADLQARLRTMVMSKNAELSSARVLPARTIGQQNYLGLRIQIQGAMGSVQEIIHYVEYGSPILFIDRAVLRADSQSLMTAGSGPEIVPVLFAELDIYGAKWPSPVVAVPTSQVKVP